jgi:hypothetical protein
LAPGAESCAACGRDEANPFTSPVASVSKPKPRGRLVELLGAMAAVVAVCGAIGFAVPGLGVVLAMVFIPAVVRAAAVIDRKAKVAGAKNSGEQLTAAVLASAGVTFAVWLASTVAFTIVCFPLGVFSFDINSGGGAGMIFAFGLGGLAGLAVFVWLMKRFWPRSMDDGDSVS